MEFKIGTQYLSSGKHKKLCTVQDILKTYNSKNELVDVRYVSSHLYMGQMVRDYDVCKVTIQRGLIQ